MEKIPSGEEDLKNESILERELLSVKIYSGDTKQNIIDTLERGEYIKVGVNLDNASLVIATDRVAHHAKMNRDIDNFVGLNLYKRRSGFYLDRYGDHQGLSRQELGDIQYKILEYLGV